MLEVKLTVKVPIYTAVLNVDGVKTSAFSDFRVLDIFGT